MSETVAAVTLTAAYALLWRHAVLKGRRLRAAEARAARLAAWAAPDAARLRMQILGEIRLGLAVNRPARLVHVSGGF